MSLRHCGGPAWPGKRGQRDSAGLTNRESGRDAGQHRRLLPFGVRCAVDAARGVVFCVLTVCRAGPACPKPTPLLPHWHLLYPLVHPPSPSSVRAISRAPCSRNAALSDYSRQYETARSTYLEAAKALKMATGPYKATRDAYVAAGVLRQVALRVRACGEGSERVKRTTNGPLTCCIVSSHSPLPCSPCLKHAQRAPTPSPSMIKLA
jgi:hypothetical protein